MLALLVRSSLKPLLSLHKDYYNCIFFMQEEHTEVMCTVSPTVVSHSLPPWWKQVNAFMLTHTYIWKSLSWRELPSKKTKNKNTTQKHN